MKWTSLNFGKYAGKTLPQVLLSDPDYFFWAMENNAFYRKGTIENEALLLNERACAVKIPDNKASKLQVEHIIHPANFTYARFDIEPTDKPVHGGGSPAFRSKYVDFSFPRTLKGYDKSGYKLFIKSFKRHILKNEKIKLTRKVSEGFFSEPNNFANR